ncbi:RNA polymerase sigma factor [Massilia sp. Mn16-1_5]|uniref:RNA polymerase sigma factor n=1 Tax=Massilia sp. Mn16-1_5 TaxID=2079199 RepID=UPI00109E512D|nr:RNA polymerase sigma factor [Massilia sp. Mn16-1_5]THC39608.1 RNA polymerase subunit sigma-24 [Massilia sp. Mn16-1_5]
MSDPGAEIVACIPRLRRYARALVGDPAGADDLVQDTVERGWARIAEWRRDRDMRAWLFGIMHNLHVDDLRAKRLQTTALDDETPDAASISNPAAALEVRDMQAALNLLPVEQREILLLVGLEGMSYDQVAATLGMPLGTVMSRLSRGREKLRTLMEGRAAPVLPLQVVK